MRVCDNAGEPVHLVLTAGPTSAYTAARCLFSGLANAPHFIADHALLRSIAVTPSKAAGCHTVPSIAQEPNDTTPL